MYSQLRRRLAPTDPERDNDDKLEADNHPE